MKMATFIKETGKTGCSMGGELLKMTPAYMKVPGKTEIKPRAP
jgi:hypothetical protein